MKADGLVANSNAETLSPTEAKSQKDGFILHLTQTSKGEVKLQLPTAEEPERIPTFYAPGAYNGGPMMVDGWDRPMIVDLGGIRFLRSDFPVRFQHLAECGVGHTTNCTVFEGKQLSISGQISRKTKYAQDVIESSKAGFPWSVSIGILVLRYDELAAGESIEINGRAQAGPAYIVRDSIFGELSFVDIGADLDARAYVMAHGKTADLFGDFDMKANAKNDAGNPAPSSEPAAPTPPPTESETVPTPVTAALPGQNVPAPEPTVTPPAPATLTADGVIQAHRTQIADEHTRIAKCQELCAGYPDLLAKAIKDGWNSDRCELEVLRASRPKPVSFVAGGSSANGAPALAQVLEAACCIAGGLSDLSKHFDERVIAEATDRFRGAIGLQEMIMECAWANGHPGRVFNRDREGALLCASARQAHYSTVRAAGLSGISINGILSNVANKFLLAGFFSVERVWPEISARRNVTDFKTVTSYRLTGKEKYEKIQPGGEIRHGTLGEESFTNRAESFGLMLSVDRRDIINDDLGAITAVPRKLGRGAALKFNEVFWDTFLDDAAHFSSGNNNLITDAFDIAGLTAAEVAFMDFEDPEGNPLGSMPSKLLVPPQLWSEARTIFNSSEIWPAIDVGDRPTQNPHSGKYPPVVSRYLKGHPTAWYLLGDPNDLPVIEACFLNGQESPTIDTAEADFNTLGIQMRGYHDFGVALQDTRGAIKSDGQGAP